MREIAMRGSLLSWVAFWFLGIAVCPVAAGQPSARPIDALIRAWSDDSFIAREAASEEIRDRGLAARAALIEALSHDDAEVRLRARRALEAILSADHQRRLAAFLSNQDPAENPLPDWRRFRTLVGSGEQSRELFIALHRSEPALLETALAGGQTAADALAIRCQQLQQYQANSGRGTRTPIPLDRICALMFVGTDQRIPFHDSSLQQVYGLLARPEFQQGLRGQSDFPQAMRRLFGAWVNATSNTNLAYRNLQLALRYEVKEALGPAIKIALDSKSPAAYRVYGLLTIGKLGGREHITLLEPLLEDKTVSTQSVRFVGGKRVAQVGQIRDAVLAVIVQLAGQPHKDYGFDVLRKNSQTLFSTNTIYLKGDEQRTQAIARWHAWRQDHPLPELPVEAPPVKFTKEANNSKTPPPQAGPQPGNVPNAKAPVQKRGAVIAPTPAGADQAAESIDIADRQSRLSVVRGAQLIEDGRFSDAVQLLGGMLAGDQGGSFQPQRDQELFLDVRREALRLLNSLPQEGRAAYELRFGAQARRRLDAAIAAGDADELRAVADAYFLTRAGSLAAWLWARDQLDNGRALPAALLLEKLRASGWAAPPTPEMSLQMALAYAQAALPSQAEAILRRLDKDATSQGALWEQVQATLRQAPPPGEWLLPRGNAARNAAPSGGGVPYLRPQWQIDTVASPAGSSPAAEVPAVRETISILRRQFAAEYIAALPAARPVGVQGRIVTQTAGELLAVNVADGQIAWRVMMQDAAGALMDSSSSPQDAPSAFQSGMDKRMWSDATFGTVTSDGRWVFSVEDVGLAYGLLNQRMVVSPDGSRRLDPGWPSNYNRLTAYDVATGKLKWEVGGPQGEFQLPLAGAYFLGPPLPLSDRLYTLAEVEGQVHLLSLDRQTGQPRDRLRLSGVEGNSDPRRRNYRGVLPSREMRRMSGLSPSYADGMLICPTGAGQYVAVDLSSGSKAWSFRTSPETGPRNPFIPMLGLAGPGGTEFRDEHWHDSLAVASQGRVLLTPIGSDRICCLTSDGQFLWTSPRQDSLYVAGVQDGTVLLIGRSGVRSLNLADGQPSWPKLPLPVGALPSGRGYFSDAQYLLPLTTGEVAVIDSQQGRIVSRSRPLQSPVPGNLLCYAGRIISQDVDHLTAFPLLKEVLAKLPDKDPGGVDLKTVRSRAEALRYAGRYGQTVELLKKTLASSPEAKLQDLLIEASIEALESDFEDFRDSVEEVRNLPFSEDQRSRYWRAVATGLQRNGELKEAFTALLEAAESGAFAPHMRPIASGLEVRLDRHLRAQLKDVYQRSQGAEREAIEAIITGRGRQAINAAALTLWLSHFAWHAQADEVRSRLIATTATVETNPLERELLLLKLYDGKQNQQRQASLARLAALWLQSNRPHQAAALYEQLRTNFRDVACLDGRTGGELFASLPKDSPVRAMLGRDTPWPAGEVAKQTTSANRASGQRNYPLVFDEVGHVLAEEPLLQLGQSGGSVIAQDRFGRKLWEIPLTPSNQASRGVNPLMVRARRWGHLLLVWRGLDLTAIDTLTPTEDGKPRVLWTRDLAPSVPGSGVAAGGNLPRIFFVPGMIPALKATDQFGRPLGKLGPVNGNAACFQRMRTLTAVNPLSGEELWKRHDVAMGSQLFGDEEHILAVAPKSDVARVFRAENGREIGAGKLPTEGDRVRLLGRHVVTWRQDENSSTLSLVDPLADREVWRREYSPAAKLWRGELNRIAVMEPTGEFQLLDAESGSPLIESRLQARPKLEELIVLSRGQRTLVIASSGAVHTALVMPIAGTLRTAVSGEVYGLDSQTGRQAWKTTVENQCLLQDMGPGLPLVVFACRIRETDEGGRSRYFSKLLCLDDRDGRKLHEESVTGTINRVELAADPGQRTITIRTSRGSTLIKFTFTGK